MWEDILLSVAMSVSEAIGAGVVEHKKRQNY